VQPTGGEVVSSTGIDGAAIVGPTEADPLEVVGLVEGAEVAPADVRCVVGAIELAVVEADVVGESAVVGAERGADVEGDPETWTVVAGLAPMVDADSVRTTACEEHADTIVAIRIAPTQLQCQRLARRFICVSPSNP